jgi:hypothetical protein
MVGRPPLRVGRTALSILQTWTGTENKMKRSRFLQSSSITLFKQSPTEERFFRWCATPNLATPDSSLGKNSAEFSVHPKIKLHKAIEMGYDFRSVGDIVNGSLLLSIPTAVWEPFSAKYSTERLKNTNMTMYDKIIRAGEKFIPGGNKSSFYDAMCLSFHLMRLLKEEHPYPMLLKENSFPGNNLFVHPILMSPSEKYLDPFLQGTLLSELIKIRQELYHQIVEELFDSKRNFSLDNQPLTRGKEQEEQQLFLWSVATILSRGVSGEYPLTMIPVFDFLNHSSSLTQLNARKRFDSQKRAFQVLATRDIRDGESIRLSYGTGRDNNSFMTIYGFIGNEKPEEMESAGEKFSVALSLPRGDHDHTTHSSSSSSSSASAPVFSFSFLKKKDLKQVFLQFLSQTGFSTGKGRKSVVTVIHSSGKIFFSHPISPFLFSSSSSSNMNEFLDDLLMILKVVQELESIAIGRPTDNKNKKEEVEEERMMTMIQVLENHLSVLLNTEKCQQFSLPPPLEKKSPENNNTDDYDCYSKRVLTILESFSSSDDSDSNSNSDSAALNHWRNSCAQILSMELKPIFQILSFLSNKKRMKP